MKTVTVPISEIKRMGLKMVENFPVIQPYSAVALKYLEGLQGIEIGPAAYQPFGLNSIGIACRDAADRAFYKVVELSVCGKYTEMDWFAEADDLRADSDSQDYVLSSHVIEHTPNPIKCFLEWNRVVKDGGYIYMIFPKREAPYGDEHRVITSLIYFAQAYGHS